MHMHLKIVVLSIALNPHCFYCEDQQAPSSPLAQQQTEQHTTLNRQVTLMNLTNEQITLEYVSFDEEDTCFRRQQQTLSPNIQTIIMLKKTEGGESQIKITAPHGRRTVFRFHDDNASFSIKTGSPSFLLENNNGAQESTEH